MKAGKVFLLLLILSCNKSEKEKTENLRWLSSAFCRGFTVELSDVFIDTLKIITNPEFLDSCLGKSHNVRISKIPIRSRKIEIPCKRERRIFDGLIYTIYNCEKYLKNEAILKFLDLRKHNIVIKYKGVEINNFNFYEMLFNMHLVNKANNNVICFGQDFFPEFGFKKASFWIGVDVHIRDKLWALYSLIYEDGKLVIIDGGNVVIWDE